MRYHDFMSDIPSPDPAIQAPPPELPLAPPVMAIPRTPAQRRLEVRIWSAFVFVLCAGMLGIGLWLTPKPAGTGSHEELGLPPCSFLATTGYPCPTCGCTTAVANFSHGHVLRSFLTQPFGFAVALVAFVLLPLTLWGFVSGSWKGPSMFWLSWHWRTWVFAGLAILLLGWVYKIIIVRNNITF
jgi:Protein of unknown function (DUF2752)